MITRHLRLVLVSFLSLVGFGAMAQFSNLIIFTQENLPFTVVMNGVQQNPEPRTHVKITGLKAPGFKVKIQFQAPGMAEINKTVYLQPETETTNSRPSLRASWQRGPFTSMLKTSWVMP